MNEIYVGDNLTILQTLPAESFDLIYIDPPFNTGKTQARTQLKTVQDDGGDRTGFGGRRYATVKVGTQAYGDVFDDFLSFIEPRLREAYRLLKPQGSFFFHIDYREVHYCKVLLDQIFGRESFINEIIWSYDYGARSTKRWSAKHDNILWYAKDPASYTFRYADIDRIPYMAPGLVGPEKAARGKTPTDCYSEDTDILTNIGWIPFSELTLQHKVASVSPEGNLEYYFPSKIHAYNYEGEMIEFKSTTVNMCVTPDHAMYVRKKTGKDFEFIKANDLITQQYALTNRFKWKSSEDARRFSVPSITYKKPNNAVVLPDFDMGDWCEFLGLYVSEGSVTFYKDRTEVTISQIKKENAEHIRCLLEKMCFRFQQHNHGFTICNKQLAEYCLQFGKSHEKHIPQNFLELPVEYLDRLYDGLMRGDGHKRGSEWTYFTISERLANNVQELIIKLGYNSNIAILKSKSPNWKPKFCVYRRLAHESTIWPKKHIKRVNYNGMVYCCTVEPYHTLIVRRAGKAAVGGNCWWNTIVSPNGKEKTGYPTQKPLAILNRIVRVHSNPGERLLDFFAGSGSFGEAAARNGREFVLIDQNPQAIEVMERRLAFAEPIIHRV